MASPVDFNGLNTVVHGPVRLGILTLLYLGGPLDFTALKKRLEVPDGALGSHLQKLEEEGYVKVKKEFVGKRPRSTYRLLPAGQAAFAKHLRNLKSIIDAVESAPRGH
ncbi:MAG TPA: transcriptional regulator [Candidatus Dormibacteraeota bacterium]|nr:transcriptional regulator [Candidatus Dormibacteraeota bacterium]